VAYTMAMGSVTITLSKREEERLTRLALRYGLSLTEFSRRVLEEVSSEIPEESLADYENPKALKNSLTRALRDWHAGRVTAELR